MLIGKIVSMYDNRKIIIDLEFQRLFRGTSVRSRS